MTDVHIRVDDMSEHLANTRVAVIGAGSWGTALANLLAAQGYDAGSGPGPSAWPSAWPGHEKTPCIFLGSRCIHASYPRPISRQLRMPRRPLCRCSRRMPYGLSGACWPELPAAALLISATKGIEASSLCPMSQVLHTTLADDRALPSLSYPGRRLPMK